MSREGKRTAESPLSDDGYEKRQCGSAEDNSFLATDSDLTIVDPEFLHCTGQPSARDGFWDRHRPIH